MLRMGSEH
jgi:hypothetical protein